MPRKLLIFAKLRGTRNTIYAIKDAEANKWKQKKTKFLQAIEKMLIISIASSKFCFYLFPCSSLIDRVPQ